MRKFKNIIPQKGAKESKVLYIAKRVKILEEKIEKNDQISKQKYRALQDFVRLLTNFASHDIKNAVHNMDGLLSTIELNQITPDDINTLKNCLDNIRLSLQEFKILSTDKDKSHFNLNELFTALNSLHRPLFKEKKITYKVDFGNVRKDLIIKHPFNSMLQVFNNLLINSYEFLEGSEYLEIRFFLNQLNSEEIEIKICDTGIGIKDSIKEKIFKPYFTTKEKGSGVGLTHVEYVLEGINGKIQLLTPDNYFNTIFLITLPTE